LRENRKQTASQSGLLLIILLLQPKLEKVYIQTDLTNSVLGKLSTIKMMQKG